MKYIDDHGIERDWDEDKNFRTPNGDLDEVPEIHTCADANGTGEFYIRNFEINPKESDN